MITRIKGDRIVTREGVIAGYVYFENEKITYVGKESRPFDREIVAEGYVLPGMIETHVHGARGFDFCEADAEGILQAAEYHFRHGATTIFPTVTSSNFERTYKALENVEKAMRMARDYLKAHPDRVPLVTVNSWNEWTETSYLLPDNKSGYGYLEAIKKVFCDE